MPDLNLEIEVKIKQIFPDGSEKEHSVSCLSVDSAIGWLGKMERTILLEEISDRIDQGNPGQEF